MRSFIETLDLRGITLFCQDWGSLIGLRVAAENEERFARIVLGNGGMPTGDEDFPGVFKAWRAFPTLVPTEPDNPASDANRLAWKEFAEWNKPFLTTFSNRDPITRGGDLPSQQIVPGAKDQDHTIVRNAGHFLQEDKGEELAEILKRFIARGT